MNKNDIVQMITESVMRHLSLNEGWYDYGPDPVFSRTDTNKNLGKNPLYVDNGNHSNADNIRQPSTIDFNGEAFKGTHYLFPDNKFAFYAVKHFRKDSIMSTMSLFGTKPALAEKSFRSAIDTIFGAARRNGKSVYFRSFSPESKMDSAKRSSYKLFTFWEFSFDGVQWFIMKPNPIEELMPSTIKLGDNPQTF